MKENLIWLAIIGLCGFGIVKCNGSDWYRASEAADAAAQTARETPHVIRLSPDGCKVYAFEAGRNTHYFTRCGTAVTTDRSYSETCGKSCTNHKTEQIVTEGNS